MIDLLDLLDLLDLIDLVDEMIIFADDNHTTNVTYEPTDGPSEGKGRLMGSFVVIDKSVLIQAVDALSIFKCLHALNYLEYKFITHLW